MTVVCLTNCPPKLRGDLTKWLLEINTGVYVGNVSARVRDELWKRITESIKSGQATMVFRSPGEQHMDFRIHNTTWKPVDYDGLKLIMRPNSGGLDCANDNLPEGFSKAARARRARHIKPSAIEASSKTYTVIDLETTGLNYGTDSIIEVGALRIRNGVVQDSYSCLVFQEKDIPREIQILTGITNDCINEQGISLEIALEKLIEFCEKDRIVCWNASFDLAFLQIGCRRCGLKVPHFKTIDAMKLARKKITRINNYSLITVAEYYGIETKGMHRALNDCYLTQNVYVRLNEKTENEDPSG